MKRALPILAAVFILAIQVTAVACPNCKDSVASTDAQSSTGVPGGFNNSVYLLLGAFLTVLGLLAGGIWRAVRTTPVTPDPRRGFPVDEQSRK
jgi:hypothetical protein